MPPSPQTVYAQLRRRDPQGYPWGYYLSPNEGADGFCWFTDLRELADFLAGGQWEALAGVAPSAGCAAELAGLLKDAEALSPGLLEELNLVLEPVAQIHWWGSWDELCQGRDGLAADLREAFREEAGKAAQDFSGLSDLEKAGFSGYLSGLFNSEA